MKASPLLLTAGLAGILSSCAPIQLPYLANNAPNGTPNVAPGAPQPGVVEGNQTPSAPAQKLDLNPNNYPLAVPTPEPGIVLSPYKPYNKVRVTKFKSGDIAKDPDNGRIFRVP